MSTPASARAFSAPPSVHNVSIQYAWDPTFVVNSNTGNWVPLTISGAGQAVIPIGGTYNPTITQIQGTGQVIIPVTAKSWSLLVMSGAAWADGLGPLLPGTALGGGGYDIRTTLARSVAIGATGASASTPLVYVTYEV